MPEPVLSFLSFSPETLNISTLSRSRTKSGSEKLLTDKENSSGRLAPKKEVSYKEKWRVPAKNTSEGRRHVGQNMAWLGMVGRGTWHQMAWMGIVVRSTWQHMAWLDIVGRGTGQHMAWMGMVVRGTCQHMAWMGKDIRRGTGL